MSVNKIPTITKTQSASHSTKSSTESLESTEAPSSDPSLLPTGYDAAFMDPIIIPRKTMDTTLHSSTQSHDATTTSFSAATPSEAYLRAYKEALTPQEQQERIGSTYILVEASAPLHRISEAINTAYQAYLTESSGMGVVIPLDTYAWAIYIPRK